MRKTAATILPILLALSWSSCQIVRSGDKKDSDDATPLQPITDEGDPKKPCDKNLSQGGRKLSGPVILVHAWGTNLLVSMSKFESYLEEEGIEKEDIHEPSYPYLLSIDRMKERLQSQYEEIAAKYPDTTQFTFITHSLGQFVALYSILGSKWEKRVKKFVALGGFVNGQNSKPALCLGNVCGPVWNRLVPHNNDFIKSFLADHTTALTKLDKCSVSSAGDNKIDDPARAGDFADGTNIYLEDEFSHRDLVREKKVFDKMVQGCFVDDIKSECIKAN